MLPLNDKLINRLELFLVKSFISIAPRSTASGASLACLLCFLPIMV